MGHTRYQLFVTLILADDGLLYSRRNNKPAYITSYFLYTRGKEVCCNNLSSSVNTFTNYYMHTASYYWAGVCVGKMKLVISVTTRNLTHI
jgi:hypothetical protein